MGTSFFVGFAAGVVSTLAVLSALVAYLLLIAGGGLDGIDPTYPDHD